MSCDNINLKTQQRVMKIKVTKRQIEALESIVKKPIISHLNVIVVTEFSHITETRKNFWRRMVTEYFVTKISFLASKDKELYNLDDSYADIFLNRTGYDILKERRDFVRIMDQITEIQPAINKNK